MSSPATRSPASLPAIRLGDGHFAPVDCSPAAGFQGCFQDGYFQVDVTGSFPLGNNYAGDVPGDVATLPRDWATLAALYGTSAADAEDTSGWDIHDDQTNREGHVAGSGCGLPAGPREAVDNCYGGGELGMFSRTLGFTNPTRGPFDPLRPNESYLPDGVIDAGDAPMPALRIDVGVSGAFGALAAADKHVIYSRNGLGAGAPANNAHNLYAPFYAAYIPATRAPQTSSGVTGELANNFPGFQNEAGLYHFWDLLNQVTLPSTSNICRDVGGDGQIDDSTFISHPRGVATATVYTDEHGEAIVRFTPDVGVRLAADSQGLCDLGEIGATPRLLATATISAQAELPFEQAQRPINATPSLTKQLFHLAGKSLDCVPKSAIEAFCVETIRDIRGNPVEGAPVAFSREPLGKFEGAELPVSTDPAPRTSGRWQQRLRHARPGVHRTTARIASDRIRRSSATRTRRVRPASWSRAPSRVSSTSMPRTSAPATAASASSASAAFASRGDGVTLVSDSATCVASPVGSPRSRRTR